MSSVIIFKGFKIIHNEVQNFYFLEGVDVRWHNLDNLKAAILRIEFGE